ncbi:hypothetical protein [Paenibacillus lautus]|uniref:hypothetical protein n=1 Tax=Paenibacillus lautus TaxID=1401 RepID=UPI002DB8B929|nr:hypothetical protein [Paenibacillus lautus]MEC0253617.1 hypothetical protein [Paenibacillus lautus]
MFKYQIIMSGLGTETMEEFYTGTESTNYKSAIAPPKSNRKLMKAAQEVGRDIEKAIASSMMDLSRN